MKFKLTKRGYVQSDTGTLELKGKASPEWLRFLEKYEEQDSSLNPATISRIKAEREARTKRLKESLK